MFGSRAILYIFFSICIGLSNIHYCSKLVNPNLQINLDGSHLDFGVSLVESDYTCYLIRLVLSFISAFEKLTASNNKSLKVLSDLGGCELGLCWCLLSLCYRRKNGYTFTEMKGKKTHNIASLLG